MSTSPLRDLFPLLNTSNETNQSSNKSNDGSDVRISTTVQYIHRFKDKPPTSAHSASESVAYYDADLIYTGSSHEGPSEVSKEASTSVASSEKSTLTFSSRSNTQDAEYKNETFTSQTTLPSQENDRLPASRFCDGDISPVESIFIEEETASLRQFHLHDADRDNEFKVGNLEAWMIDMNQDENY